MTRDSTAVRLHLEYHMPVYGEKARQGNTFRCSSAGFFCFFSADFRPEMVTKLCQRDINPPSLTAKIALHTKNSGIFWHFPYKFMTKFGGNNILYTGCTYVTIQMIYQLYEQKGGKGVHKGGFQSRVRADGGCSMQFLHHLFPSPDA